VDECAEGISTCDQVSTECVNVPGGYFCQCRQGFRPNGTSMAPAGRLPVRWSCADADECSGWSGGHRCPVGTVCRNTVGSYECVCQADDASCHEVISKSHALHFSINLDIIIPNFAIAKCDLQLQSATIVIVCHLRVKRVYCDKTMVFT